MSQNKEKNILHDIFGFVCTYIMVASALIVGNVISIGDSHSIIEDYDTFYMFDEGEGQYCYDSSENDLKSDNDKLYLGETIYDDDHDPLWSSNSGNGLCLTFYENLDSIVQSIIPYNIINQDIYLEFDFFPSDNDYNTHINLIAFNDAGVINSFGIYHNHLYYLWNNSNYNHFTNYTFNNDTWINVRYNFNYQMLTESLEINGERYVDNQTIPINENRLMVGFLHIGSIKEGYNYYGSYNGLIDNIGIITRPGLPGIPGIPPTITKNGLFALYDFQYLDTYKGFPNIIRNKAPGSYGSGYMSSNQPYSITDGINYGANIATNYMFQDLQGIYSGNCLNFDGNDYINFPNYNQVNFPKVSWTFECWIYPTDISVGQPSSYGISNVIFSYSKSGNARTPLEIGIDPSTSRLQFRMDSIFSTASGSSTCLINEDEWTHISMVFYGGPRLISPYLKIYKNFIYDSTHTIVNPYFPSISVDPSIGTSLSVAGGNGFYKGLIDDVKIHSSSKIIGGPVALYRFDTSPNYDGSTHGNDISGLTNNDQTTDSLYYGSKSLKTLSTIGQIASPDNSICPSKITIEGWIKIDGQGSSTEYIVDMRYSMSYSSYAVQMIFQDNKYYLKFIIYNEDNNEKSIISNSEIISNKWYHFTCTYDDSFQKMALNGYWDKKSSISGTNKNIKYSASKAFYLSGTSSGNGNFNGIIDELVISNYVKNLLEDEDNDGINDFNEIKSTLGKSKQYRPYEFNGRYAILVGSNYETDPQGQNAYALSDAVTNDIMGFRSLLQSKGWHTLDIYILMHQYYISTSIYQINFERYNICGIASSNDLTQSLSIVASKSRSKDTVFFLYVGHGIGIPFDPLDPNDDEDYDNVDESFALYDNDGVAEYYRDSTYASNSLSIHCRHFLHTFICCHSGGFFEDIRQSYNSILIKPWTDYIINTATHSYNDWGSYYPFKYTYYGNSLLYALTSFNIIPINSPYNRPQYDATAGPGGHGRCSYGRVDWDPDIDCTYNNIKKIETDSSPSDPSTKTDGQPNWQRNHYTDNPPFNPGNNFTNSGQDYPELGWRSGLNDYAVRFVSYLPYMIDISDNNKIIDFEEAFYYAIHNEYLMGGYPGPSVSPEINIGATDNGDDPLIYDDNDEAKYHF